MLFCRAQKAHLKEPSRRSPKRALGLYASSAYRPGSLFPSRSFPSRFPPSIYKPGSLFVPLASCLCELQREEEEKGDGCVANVGYGEGWERAGRCPDLRPPPEVLLPRPRLPHYPQTEGRRAGYQDELPKKNLRKELEEREWRHFASKAKSYAEDRDRRKGGQVLWKEQGEKLKIELFRVIMMLMILMQKSKMMQRVMAMMMMTRMIKALLAELERIKKEQAKEKLNKERRQQAEVLKDKEAELMRGNPLININNSSSFSVERWDDDVVLENKTRGETKTP